VSEQNTLKHGIYSRHFKSMVNPEFNDVFLEKMEIEDQIQLEINICNANILRLNKIIVKLESSENNIEWTLQAFKELNRISKLKAIYINMLISMDKE